LFGDAPDRWCEEREVFVTPRTFRRRMGSGSEALLWEDLREGRVYLSGAFAVRGDVEKPDGFELRPQSEAFMRIDHLPQVRDAGRKLYARLLHGEAGHDATDKR
jgi:hypothetical protein